jgi:hypothetical protein
VLDDVVTTDKPLEDIDRDEEEIRREGIALP